MCVLLILRQSVNQQIGGKGNKLFFEVRHENGEREAEAIENSKHRMKMLQPLWKPSWPSLKNPSIHQSAIQPQNSKVQ